jgi:hypothetical protein
MYGEMINLTKFHDILLRFVLRKELWQLCLHDFMSML